MTTTSQLAKEAAARLFTEGASTRISGLVPLSANPYIGVDTAQAHAWEQGWLRANHVDEMCEPQTFIDAIVLNPLINPDNLTAEKIAGKLPYEHMQTAMRLGIDAFTIGVHLTDNCYSKEGRAAEHAAWRRGWKQKAVDWAKTFMTPAEDQEPVPDPAALGRSAYHDGQPLSANPFPKSGDTVISHKQWDGNWRRAQEDDMVSKVEDNLAQETYDPNALRIPPVLGRPGDKITFFKPLNKYTMAELVFGTTRGQSSGAKLVAALAQQQQDVIRAANAWQLFASGQIQVTAVVDPFEKTEGAYHCIHDGSFPENRPAVFAYGDSEAEAIMSVACKVVALDTYPKALAMPAVEDLVAKTDEDTRALLGSWDAHGKRGVTKTELIEQLAIVQGQLNLACERLARERLMNLEPKPQDD